MHELNRQQEANAKLGLTPALEAEIANIRNKWRREHQPIPVEFPQVQMSPGFTATAVSKLRAHWRRTAFVAILALLCVTQRAHAGSITGQIQTATGGVIANGTLTFHLSQPIVIAGSGLVVSQDVNCYTATTGNVVGLPDVLVAPVVNTNTSSGSLASGTYYTKITYYGAGGEVIASPETTTVLSATGTLIVNPPTLQPASATGYKVYIGSTSGAETLQGAVTGWTQYQQTSALAAGSSLPATNTTVCSIHFSDEGIPTGTYYSVNLVNKSGSKIAGFPQTWCTYGGASGTINVSNGAPTGSCGSQGAFYPTPIFANPANNAPQSISGPVTFTSSGVFTGSPGITVSNPGVFTNSQMNEYATFSLNGGSSATEFHRIFPAQNATEAVSAVSGIPVGATVFQHNNIASYVVNQTTTTKGVALVGQCYDTSTGSSNAGCFGLNTIVSDAGGPLAAGPIGYEDDLNIVNAGSNPVGGLIAGNWSAQPANAYGWQIAQPGATVGGPYHWTHAIRLEQGATLSPSLSNGAGLWFQPLASGTNQASQGIEFVANDPTSGINGASVNETASGSLQIQQSKATVPVIGPSWQSQNTGAPNFLLNTAGVGFGQIMNLNSTTWALGYGNSATTNGTAVAQWNTSNQFQISSAGLLITGATSGTSTLQAPATGGVTNTLPSTMGTLAVTVAFGTATMTTAAIAAGTCGTTVTASATGVATTDAISWSYNAAPAANPGQLELNSWPTANNVNFEYCNPTAGSITPNAATLNWRVGR